MIDLNSYLGPMVQTWGYIRYTLDECLRISLNVDDLALKFYNKMHTIYYVQVDWDIDGLKMKWQQLMKKFDCTKQKYNHNIIQSHNNVSWDWQYYAKYLSKFNMNMENIPYNIVSHA